MVSQWVFVVPRRRERRSAWEDEEQYPIELWLWTYRKRLGDIVWQALYDLHMEIGCNRSFQPGEIAERAGLPQHVVRFFLERYWALGLLVKRRNNRYKIRDNLLQTCLQIQYQARKILQGMQTEQ